MAEEFIEPEISKQPQHRAPVWFQLSLAITYYLLIAFFSGLGEDTGISEQFKNDPQGILMLKVAQLLAVFFVFILPVIIFSVVLRKEKIKFLNLNKKPGLVPATIGLLICIVALPLVSGTASWNQHMHLPEGMQHIEKWMQMKEKTANETIELFFTDRTIGNMIQNLLVVGFMAGLSEEIFFRGFLQRLFMENKINLHVAVWITAILFSAIHIQFFGFIPRMLLGAVLGYLYAYTNNLWVPIIAHTVNNSFAVVMAYITGSISDDPLSKDGEQSVGIPLIALSTLLVTGMIYLLFRVWKTRQKSEEAINKA